MVKVIKLQLSPSELNGIIPLRDMSHDEEILNMNSPEESCGSRIR